MNKKDLRQSIRAAKKQHTPEELRKQSAAVMQKLAEHPRFLAAEKVMLYASLPDEVETLAFIESWRHRKTIVLPTVVGDDIIPVELADDTAFAEGDFHIPEPQNHPYTGDFDLIVVPGMAFDAEGHRLGRGRGYYAHYRRNPDRITQKIVSLQVFKNLQSHEYNRTTISGNSSR